MMRMRHLTGLTVLLVALCLQVTRVCAVQISIPNPGNCGETTTVVCSVDAPTVGWTFSKGVGNTIIATIRGIRLPNKYTAVTGTNSVTLSILDTQYSDVDGYFCYIGFYGSSRVTLQYQCKATSARTSQSILPSKKLQIISDKLYPTLPTMSVTLTQPSSTTLPGTRTCAASTAYPNHYRCVWTSSNSLPVGSYTSSLVVTTVSSSDAITDTFVIATPGTPTVSNLVTVNNRDVVRGRLGQSLTLTCTSTGGYPVQTVAFYRGSVAESNQLASKDSGTLTAGRYTVILAHSFTPATSDDLDTMICTSSYPQADQAQRGLQSKSFQIYLYLRCNTPVVTQTNDATATTSVTMTCAVSACRPAPTITWSYNGSTYTGTSGNPTSEGASETFSRQSEYSRQVAAADNGRTIECIVTYPTASGIQTQRQDDTINVNFAPTTTTITGNRVFNVSNGATLSLTCTTGSSNPASDITWTVNGQTMTSNTDYTTTDGANSGKIRSQVLVLTPTRDMDGHRVTCFASNTFNSQPPASSSVDLDLRYRPIINTLSDIAVEVGTPNVVLPCTASSKPASTFNWFQGNTLVAGPSTATIENNAFSYEIAKLEKHHTGTYICQANNAVGQKDTKPMQLTVQYPPDVNIIAHNVSVTDVSMSLLCNAAGVPAIYTYGSWIQTWSDNQAIKSWPSTGAWLNHTLLTYEHSGFYTCFASNGKKVYGSTKEHMNGSTYIRVKSFPIIIQPSLNDGDVYKVHASFGGTVTFTVTFYSNTDDVPEINMYKVNNTKKQVIDSTMTTTDVDLPVFDTSIVTTGTTATIALQDVHADDFTEYEVEVKNEIGKRSVNVLIVPQGPPEAPTIVGSSDVAFTSATISWIERFNGGFTQTYVIQTSTDEITWSNATEILDTDFETTTNNQSATIDKLTDGTLYYVRMFSYNKEGMSDHYSQTINFTTEQGTRIPVMDITDESSSQTAAIVGSTLGSILLLTLIVVIVVVVRRKYSIVCIEKKDASQASSAVTGGANNSQSENYTALNVLPSTSSATEYASLHSAHMQQEGESSTYEQVVAETDEHTYEQSNTTYQNTAVRDATVYENLKLQP